MFLSKDYVLGNELIEKMGIKIGNVSVAHKELEEVGNETDIIKLNNCSFLNKNSTMLPKNLTQGLNQYEFTDISKMLPMSYVLEEFKLNKAMLEKLLLESPIFQEKIKISGKNFIKFSDEFINNVSSAIIYVLNEQEKEECLKDESIDGFLKLGSNKYLTWYNVESFSTAPSEGF